MFEGIPGQDEKVGRFFPANLGDAPTGVQSDRSHPISDGANLYRSHSDLPITRMHKPHTEIMHQEVAHGMSYLEDSSIPIQCLRKISLYENPKGLGSHDLDIRAVA
jgi:hypothetical protein